MAFRLHFYFIYYFFYFEVLTFAANVPDSVISQFVLLDTVYTSLQSTFNSLNFPKRINSRCCSTPFAIYLLKMFNKLNNFGWYNVRSYLCRSKRNVQFMTNHRASAQLFEHARSSTPPPSPNPQSPSPSGWDASQSQVTPHYFSGFT